MNNFAEAYSVTIPNVNTWIRDQVQIDKPNTVRRSDYKGVSRVSIISEHVKDLTIYKMATSMIVITPPQAILLTTYKYIRGVTARKLFD